MLVFYGIVSCYVERPVRDLIKELWVYQYSLALCKTSADAISSSLAIW